MSLSPSRSPEQARQQGLVILLVDDNPINRKVICRQLERLGYAVDVADNGVQALQLWHEHPYVLVLTDCHMPEMDGFELARQIRQAESGQQHVPILALTADAMQSARDKCFAAGMDAYLTKPVQMLELQETLGQWSGATGMPAAERTSTPESGPTERLKTAPPPVDSNGLIKVIGTGEREILQAFYQEFIGSSETQITQLTEAVAAHDQALVQHLAHKLRSAVRTIGAFALGDLCERLEQQAQAGQSAAFESSHTQLTAEYRRVCHWIEQNYPAET